MQDSERSLPDDVAAINENMAALSVGPSKDEGYRGLVERLCGGGNDEAVRALKWVLCSKRPLTFAELADAVATDEHDGLQTREQIIAPCHGLFKDIGGYASFSDPSIRSYLEGTPGFSNRDKCEEGLALSCIGYLSRFTEGPCKARPELHDQHEKHPFFDYAACNWGHHVTASYQSTSGESESEELQSSVLAFLNNDALRDAMVQALHVSPHSPLNPCPGKLAYFDGYPRSSTPLHLAAYFDMVPEARILLGLPGNINNSILLSRDSDQQTALHVAASAGSNNFIKLLLSLPAAEIDVNDVAGSHKGGTPLCLSAGAGHYHTCDLLLKHGASVMRAWPQTGWGPLLAASKGGYANIVLLLLAHRGVVSGRNRAGRSPLLEAVEGGHVGVVKILLDHGAGKEMLVTANFSFATPLRSAVEGGDEIIVEMMLDDAAKEGLEVDGGTLVKIAAENGNVDVIRLLGERNLVPDDAIGGAVYQAAYKGQEHVVDLFLGGSHSISGYRNEANGWTCLHAAVHKYDPTSSVSIIGKLVSAGVPIDASDNGGETALHRAALRVHTSHVEALLGLGANVNSHRLDGMTPMHLAVESGAVDVVEILLKTPELNLDARDGKGRTALHVAAEREHLKSRPKAYFSGANRMREENVFATHEMVELIAHSASGKQILNTTDKDGRTALHLCAETGNAGVAQFLVKYGADVTMENYENSTARQIAERNGFQHVVKALNGEMAEVIGRRWKRRADPSNPTENRA